MRDLTDEHELAPIDENHGLVAVRDVATRRLEMYKARRTGSEIARREAVTE